MFKALSRLIFVKMKLRSSFKRSNAHSTHKEKYVLFPFIIFVFVFQKLSNGSIKNDAWIELFSYALCTSFKKVKWKFKK